MSSVQEVREITNQAELEFEIDNFRDGLTIVYYYANASEACALMGPMVDEISVELAKTKFFKVDIAKLPELLASFGIGSVPSFVVFKDAKQLGHLEETKVLTARNAIVNLVRGYS